MTVLPHWQVLIDNVNAEPVGIPPRRHVGDPSDLRWSLCGIWVGTYAWVEGSKWDDLEKCPKCVMAIDGRTTTQTPEVEDA